MIELEQVELGLGLEGGRGVCERCVAELRDVLERRAGVARIVSPPGTGRLQIYFDAATLKAASVREFALAAVGELATRYRHERFSVKGLECNDCAREIELAVLGRGGVVGARIELAGSTLNVEFKPAEVGVGEIINAVGSVGYAAAPALTVSPRTRIFGLVGLLAAERRFQEIAFAGLLLALAALAAWAAAPGPLVWALLLVAVAACGHRMGLSGFVVLVRDRRLNINLLMTIAVAGAIALGELGEAAVVTVLFALGEALEELSMDRTRRSIRSLLDRAPVLARVLRNGQEHMEPADRVKPGDRIGVRPGEGISADGVVIEGHSTVAQAALTGEPMPAPKSPGDELFAGTLNGEGYLEIVASRPGNDTRLAGVVRMVEDSQARRAPVQKWVDRFAAVYTPAVVAIAAGISLAPPLLFGQPAGEWLWRGLVLLVVACPCALVISTPVAFVSALASASRNGVLVKGGVYLEAMGRLKGMAFDKTGTLTLGSPTIGQIVTFAGHSEDEFLALAAALEARSDHAVARAVRLEAQRKNVRPLGPVTDFVVSPRGGVQARLGDRMLRAGSQRFLESHGISTKPAQAAIAAAEAHGDLTFLVADATEIVGFMSLRDPVRADAAGAIEALTNQGVRRLAMLTGDGQGAAAAVAAEAGIREWQAELLPEDKVRAVAKMRDAGGPVAMVGDGINDAPALAAADVGIAMGAVGSDVAIETADVALMSDDLARLAEVVALGKRTLRTVKLNIGIALGSKLAFLGLATAGVATLWMAILADVGATLIVIVLAMRLLRHEWRKGPYVSAAHVQGHGAPSTAH